MHLSVLGAPGDMDEQLPWVLAYTWKMFAIHFSLKRNLFLHIESLRDDGHQLHKWAVWVWLCHYCWCWLPRKRNTLTLLLLPHWCGWVWESNCCYFDCVYRSILLQYLPCVEAFTQQSSSYHLVPQHTQLMVKILVKGGTGSVDVSILLLIQPVASSTHPETALSFFLPAGWRRCELIKSLTSTTYLMKSGQLSKQ